MKIGYARTSTLRQVYSLDEQIERLRKYGCNKIFSEQKSSIYARPVFDEACKILREGDEFVVCSLDRLARNVQHFEQILKDFSEKNIKLKVLNLGIDFNTPTGKLMLQLIMSFAEFERNNMLERQKVGIEKAKEKGLIGRHFPKEKEKKIMKAIAEYDPEKTSIAELAKSLNVSAPTLYARIKKKFPHIKTRRRRREQIIKENFNGDATAYKMFRILSRMSEAQRNNLKKGFL